MRGVTCKCQNVRDQTATGEPLQALQLMRQIAIDDIVRVPLLHLQIHTVAAINRSTGFTDANPCSAPSAQCAFNVGWQFERQ